MTEEEVTFYEKELNKSDGEWYEPYALQEEINALICRYDSCNQASDKIFVKISNEERKMND